MHAMLMEARRNPRGISVVIATGNMETNSTERINFTRGVYAAEAAVMRSPILKSHFEKFIAGREERDSGRRRALELAVRP